MKGCTHKQHGNIYFKNPYQGENVKKEKSEIKPKIRERYLSPTLKNTRMAFFNPQRNKRISIYKVKARNKKTS